MSASSMVFPFEEATSLKWMLPLFSYFVSKQFIFYPLLVWLTGDCGLGEE